MKKVLFILVSVMMCLSSCKRVPNDVMRADFMYAFADYEYRESHLNCECVKRVYDAKGEYILDANKLTDSLTIVMDKAASECFDSLYIKYGDEVVSDMVKRSKGVYLPSKESVYRYYVDGSVTRIMENVVHQVNVQLILNPTEEVINKKVSEYLNTSE